MQNAETVLDVLRERGRRGLPCEELYRQLLNPRLYLLAYGRIYSNKGAMTAAPDAETADGMTMAKIERIIDALRHERYRFRPVRRHCSGRYRMCWTDQEGPKKRLGAPSPRSPSGGGWRGRGRRQWAVIVLRSLVGVGSYGC
jgi:hypothetical protein